MKKRIYKIRLQGDKQWCVVSENEARDAMFGWVEGLTEGEVLEVMPFLMTQSEIDSLPEFEG